MFVLSILVIGLFLASGFTHLAIYYHNRKRHIYLTLARLSFFSAFYLYQSASIHFPYQTISDSLGLQMFGYAYLFQALCLVWSLYFFVNDRKLLPVTMIPTAVIIIIGVANAAYPNSIVFADAITWEELVLPWGEKYVQPKEANAVWSYVAPLYYLPMLVYFVFLLIKLKRGRSSRKHIIFLNLILLFIGFNLYDVLVDLTVIDFVYLTEFAMLPIILLLNHNMALEIREKYLSIKNLESERQKYQTLVEKVNLAVVITNLKKKVTYANPFFCQLVKSPSEAIQGSSFIEKFIPTASQTETEEVFTTFITGKGGESYTKDLLIKSGNLRTIEWSNVALRDNDGRLTGIISIGADVTERHRYREQLESTLEELKNLKKKLEEENTYLRQNLALLGTTKDRLLGSSTKIKMVKQDIFRLANSDVTVLIEGETGVGKDVVAHGIYASGKWSERPYITVNCGALPRELIESELFGHVKGAFTGATKERKGRFELANNGTLFLDEIGELPLELQPKLLRVLQTGEFEKVGGERTKTVKVRVIAATNRDLKALVTEGCFRADLYYRLSVFPVYVPPLRERKEDIPSLTQYFVEEFCKTHNKSVLKIPLSVMSRFQQHSWPGNVRELRNVLERGVVSSSGFKLTISQTLETKAVESTEYSLEGFERKYILEILDRYNWKISGKNSASSVLNLKESTLRYKMKKLGIERPYS